MKNLLPLITLFLLFLSLTAHAADAPPLLASPPADHDAQLVSPTLTADVYVDPKDATVARIAAQLLTQDIQRVTNKKPALKNDTTSLTSTAILVGTLGQSPVIDSLAASGKLNVTKVRGLWETFVIQVVDNPLPNVSRALVIAGSDRRGTAFGVFELSEQIGVSPWYWWADSTPTHRDTLAIKATTAVVGPPSVKYRGIFINDEDWGLKPWAATTFDPALGNIGPKTYEKVFELLLRLKGNYLWPAMHPCSTEFGSIDANITLADDWAIVMGASHAEPMNRNNVWWDKALRGEWRYDTNRDNVYKYWEQWAKKRGPYEAVWTVGMRGIHDSGMNGPKDVDAQVKLLQQAITDQRTLLSKYVNPKIEQVPQAFMPYKEALNLYQHGLKVPDDVTLVWCDDNYGYIRQMSTPEEQKRSGRAGVYYHISYLGTPKPYLWVDTTPPALIWEEMTRAAANGADRVWVLNVGDIKPGERGMEFWLKLGWNLNRYKQDPQLTFLQEWATREFGEKQAPSIAQLMNTYYHLAFDRKPELMDDKSFSPTNGEAQQRFRQYMDQLSDVKFQAESLPPEKQDAYFELVAYPVRVAAHTNIAMLGAQLSKYYADRASLRAYGYAYLAENAVKDLDTDTQKYNEKIADGKWKGIMTEKGMAFTTEYAKWNPNTVLQWPKPVKILPSDKPEFGILVNGQRVPANGEVTLPTFVEGGHIKRVFQLVNLAQYGLPFTTKTSADWIEYEPDNPGMAYDLDGSHELAVNIDWAKAPPGPDLTGIVTLTAQSKTWTLHVHAIRPPKEAQNAYFETDGTIAIEAQNFSRNIPQPTAAWKTIENLGHASDAMIISPGNAPAIHPTGDWKTKSPCLQYDVFLTTTSPLTVQVSCLPTLPMHPDVGVRYAIAFDDQPPQIVDSASTGGTTGDGTKAWEINVTRNSAVSASKHTLTTPGRHTLKIYMIDPSVVLDHLTITHQ